MPWGQITDISDIYICGGDIASCGCVHPCNAHRSSPQSWISVWGCNCEISNPKFRGSKSKFRLRTAKFRWLIAKLGYNRNFDFEIEISISKSKFRSVLYPSNEENGRRGIYSIIKIRTHIIRSFDRNGHEDVMWSPPSRRVLWELSSQC